MITDEMKRAALEFRRAALEAGNVRASICWIGEYDGWGDYIDMTARTLEQVTGEFDYDGVHTFKADSEEPTWKDR